MPGWFALPEYIRTRLLAVPAIASAVGERIHYQELPSDSEYPHVWFARSSRDREPLLDGEFGDTVERFAIEIVSDTDAGALVGSIAETLESLSGEFDDSLIQLIEVEDADDDYYFQSIGEDIPDYTHALRVAVYVVPLN